MFNGARNVVIQGGTFIVNTDNSTNGRLDRFLEEVAPNAILNAGGRADEVRCYPGTREELISKMEKWIDGEDARTSRMMWLSGPAGAGKSAIIQSVAERCQADERHAVNFFFFRGDGTRNHAQPLVATLVYQLRTLYPALDKLIVDCLTATPLISKASIGEQFEKLISAPIHIIQNSSSVPKDVPKPIILLIDGLDECDDKTKQEQILVALHALVRNEDSPFLIVIASRAESQIVMSFNNIGPSAVSIFLDDEYRPQDDIRHFVIAKFNEIKVTHRLAHTLDEQWPTAADIDAIVGKSSGQFIYAATAMRFIQYSSASPSLSLLTVHGIRLAAADHSPYAQLDAVYSYILSKSQDLQAVQFCLCAHLIITGSGAHHYNFDASSHYETLLNYAGYGKVEIESLFADLAAIVSIPTGPHVRLAFYHASFSDYLLEKSRSGIYHVEKSKIATELSTRCLGRNLDSMSWLLGVSVLPLVTEATPALSKSLLDASEVRLDKKGLLVTAGAPWECIIIKIYELYFASDRTLFKQMLRCWIRFARMNDIGIGPVANFHLPPLTMSRDTYIYYEWYTFTSGLEDILGLHK